MRPSTVIKVLLVLLVLGVLAVLGAFEPLGIKPECPDFGLSTSNLCVGDNR